MGVTTEELVQIETLLSASGPLDFVELRKKFPHLTWTKCDASDVIEEPFRSFKGYDVHLLNAKDHCVQVTTEPGEATGFAIAYKAANS
jgi:hypothetical protein